jgi:hypothetical protein
MHVGICVGSVSADLISKVFVRKGSLWSVSSSMERVVVYGVQMVE